MVFKDDRLQKDPEILELRGLFHEIGSFCPPWNWDEYTDWDDYKKKCWERLELLKNHPELVEEQKKRLEEDKKKYKTK
jgi:hypothetical protein